MVAGASAAASAAAARPARGCFGGEPPPERGVRFDGAREGRLLGIKTGEDNYSAGWRAGHAQRRFEGVEGPVGTLNSGKAAWQDLSAAESAAVAIVAMKADGKKAAAKEGRRGKTGAEAANAAAAKEEEEEEALAPWRATLKTRRAGLEPPVAIPSAVGKPSVDGEWRALLGAESGALDRVERPKGERLAAAKAAEKKAMDKNRKGGGEYRG